MRLRGAIATSFFGQLDCRHIGQSQKSAVLQLSQLLPDGPHHRRMPVPVDVRPERGNTIQIPVAFGVEEIDSLATLDHELWRIHPVAHLGERVPEMLFVESFVVDAWRFTG